MASIRFNRLLKLQMQTPDNSLIYRMRKRPITRKDEYLVETSIL